MIIVTIQITGGVKTGEGRLDSFNNKILALCLRIIIEFSNPK